MVQYVLQEMPDVSRHCHEMITLSPLPAFNHPSHRGFTIYRRFNNGEARTWTGLPTSK